jgi:PhnB protein
MTTNPIPDGYDSLIPSLVVRDGARAIDFYKEVFGATELMRMNHPNSSKIAHAEIKIRNHVLMLGDECPEMGILSPKSGNTFSAFSVMIYVQDVDALYNRAVSKGAKPTMPLMDMFWGDRFGKFEDPFGHVWTVASRTKVVTKQECEASMAAWAKKEQPQSAAVA